MIQKQKLENSQVIFFFLILIVIISCFFLLVPKISSRIFPLKRAIVLNNFIGEVKKNDGVDPQEFWEFREFYSPGYFKFSDKGIDQFEINTTLSNFGLNPQKVTLYFSKFESKNLESLDGLTTNSNLNDLISQANIPSDKILFKNESTIIYKNMNNNTFIIFMLPVYEMSKANGFFDYNGANKQLLKGKTWINITKLND